MIFSERFRIVNFFLLTSNMLCGSSDDIYIEQINVPDTEPDYPPPSPPTSRKEQVFKVENCHNLDANAKSTPKNLCSSYNQLVPHLTQFVKTDVEKVRAIFSWLSVQQIFNMKFNHVRDIHTPNGYMKTIQQGNGSYTGFFALLCRAAGVPCVVVRGVGKSGTYDVGQQDLSTLHSTWNAVYVDGCWRLVHPFWAFVGLRGFNKGGWTKLEESGKVIRKLEKASSGKRVYTDEDFWFLTDPDEFVNFCLPNEPEWQLLQPPWIMKKFANVPYFTKHYFCSGLVLVSEHAAILKSRKGRRDIAFEHAENMDVELDYTLFYDEHNSGQKLSRNMNLERYVIQYGSLTRKSLRIRFPVVGIYKIKITSITDRTNVICSFRLECYEALTEVQPYPVKPKIGFGFGKAAANVGLTQPSRVNGIISVRQGEKITLQFRCQRKVEVQSVLAHAVISSAQLASHVMHEQSGDDLRVTVHVPWSKAYLEYALLVNVRPEGSDGAFENAVNYLLTEEDECEDSIYCPREDDIKIDVIKSTPSLKQKSKKSLSSDVDCKLRKRLIEATDGYDRLRLETAIQEFEKEELPDLGDLMRARRKLMILSLGGKAKEKNPYATMTEDMVRKRLVEATDSNDINFLEKIIKHFETAGYSDCGDLTRGRRRLISLHEDALREASRRRNLEELDMTIARTYNSCVASVLYQSEAMQEADETRSQLRRLRLYLHKILELTPTTVSEVYSYKRPRPLIHTVMKATLVLLGEEDENLKRWSFIQLLMRRQGRDGIINRIKEFDLVNLPMSSISSAESHLSNCNRRLIRQTSAGASAFYVWLGKILEQVPALQEAMKTQILPVSGYIGITFLPSNPNSKEPKYH